MKEAANEAPAGRATARTTNAATGLSLVATVAAGFSATCCVLPIALTILGFGGGWLAFLGFFATNRPYILATSLILLALTAFLMWRQNRSCAKNGQKQRAGKPARIVFVVAAILLTGAVSAPLWEREATRYLWNVWISQ
jgi:mercuric ion transport protein